MDFYDWGLYYICNFVNMLVLIIWILDIGVEKEVVEGIGWIICGDVVSVSVF